MKFSISLFNIIISKKILFNASIIILIFAPVILTAQKKDLSKSENGFRVFHFGDSVEQYGKNVCEWFPVENIDRYKYCGADSSVYFMNKIRFDNVVLCFNSKKQLFKIGYGLLITDKTILKDYKKEIEAIQSAILNYLNGLYGKSIKKDSADDRGSFLEWKYGKTVVSFYVLGGKETYWCRFDVYFQLSN